MAIKHKKTSFAEDGTDPNAVHPSDWNDDHVLDGFLALFADLGVGPDMFPYIKTDGTGALAPVSVPARNFLAQVTAQLMLAAIGAAGLASPAFTGTPTAPTPTLGLNTDQIATMAALKAMRDDLVNGAPGALDALNELAAALGNDPNFATTMTTALGNRLRFDAAQSLTAPQKAQAIANLALAAVAASGAYADLSGKPTLGTAAALNVGTAANQVVQLDGSAKLPALDGSQLINLGANVRRVTRQIFTASGTYAPSAGMLYAIVENVGAGAGGGGSAGFANIDSGGGGGGGEYARKFVTAADIGASKPVTIGAAGTAGPNGAAGGAGGDTSLGTLCIAKGGLPGTGSTTTAPGAGGLGGTGGTGDLLVPGQRGEAGQFASFNTMTTLGSSGGNSGFGFGQGGRQTPIGSNGGAGVGVAGVAGSGYGGGGSGSIVNNHASGNTGAAGTSGLCIVTEFCSQ